MIWTRRTRRISDNSRKMWDTFWKAFWEHVWSRLHVIKEHWPTFVALAGVATFAAIIITRSVDNQQITNFQSTIGTQQNHIGLLQDRINILQQNQAGASSVPPSQWRRLTDRQRDVLISTLKRPENKISTLIAFAMADSESRQYASQFVDVARAASIDVRPREVPLSIQVDVGVMIGLTTYPKPSEDAGKLKSALDAAGVENHYTLWAKTPDDTQTDFDLFVGPKPW